VSDLPFLAENWRKRADGIANHSLAQAFLAEKVVGDGALMKQPIPPPGEGRPRQSLTNRCRSCRMRPWAARIR
jgi:hypothetical protein